MLKLAYSAIVATVVGITCFQASAEQLDRTFGIVNESNRAIVAVRVGHIDRDPVVSRNLLYGNVLQPGDITTIEPVRDEGYCRFNVQITFDNGGVQNISDVNLCEALEVVTYGYNRSRQSFYHDII